MSYIDARGAQQDFDVLASAGINLSGAITDDGSARDLSSTTLTVVVKDDVEQARDYGGEYGSETSYSLTVTDAAGGLFAFIIPASEFTNKEGGRLTYELYMTESDTRTGLMWGYINVLERG